jgi:hypothetical protein
MPLDPFDQFFPCYGPVFSQCAPPFLGNSFIDAPVRDFIPVVLAKRRFGYFFELEKYFYPLGNKTCLVRIWIYDAFERFERHGPLTLV